MMNSEYVAYPLKIQGAFSISLQSRVDNRGSMLRIWDSQGVLEKFELKQASFVSNPSPKTLRGIHYQEEPFAENKILYCVSGLIFDVIIDLRETSKTYLQHEAIEIGPKNPVQGLFVPKGCAHGYLTITQHSNLVYFMDKPYSAQNARGLLWKDPKLKIKWPFNPMCISDRDKNWPNLK
jgi:dTDP-4-dehydrorhamnose 3,5-epimerase